jgi:hypothetical protein
MTSLLNILRRYLGGDEYRQLLESDIRHHLSLSNPIPEMGKDEQRRRQRHRTKFYELQSLYFELYGHNYGKKK